MAVRAHDVGGGYQFFCLFALKTGNVDLQRHFDAEAGAVFARTDANGCRHSRVFRNLYLLLAGDSLQGAEEAGGITGCEKLLRIGAAGAIAAAARAGTGEWAIQGAWAEGLAAWRQDDCKGAADAFGSVAGRSGDVELAAAAQRRDSINAQLSNVRQMLATLTGTVPGVVGLSDAPTPSATAPHGDPVADAAREESAAPDTAESVDDQDDTPDDTPESSEER